MDKRDRKKLLRQNGEKSTSFLERRDAMRFPFGAGDLEAQALNTAQETYNMASRAQRVL